MASWMRSASVLRSAALFSNNSVVLTLARSAGGSVTSRASGWGRPAIHGSSTTCPFARSVSPAMPLNASMAMAPFEPSWSARAVTRSVDWSAEQPDSAASVSAAATVRYAVIGIPGQRHD
ncbi:hypothetical protein D9M70_591580 [compost metagenome]